MSVTTTPPPVSTPPKKKGMGCLGCGCLIVSLLVLLFLVILVSLGYVVYNKAYALTSAQATPIVAFDGGDNFYAATKEKIDNFNNDLKNHQASKLQLSGDEINSLLTRDPYFVAHNVHVHVTLNGDQATVEGSFPPSAIRDGLFPERYVNFSASFGLNFTPSDKVLTLAPTSLQAGDTVVPQQGMPAMQMYATMLLNEEIQKRPELKIITDQAKTISIKSGSLVIETQ